MKKILILLIVVAGGWWACNSIGGKKEEPVAVAPMGAAPAKIPQAEATAGKVFNKMFPASGGGFDVQFTQEKDGYAQADVLKSGKKLAQLSVSDTAANPAAKDKFKAAAKRIAGLPAAAVGSMGTAVLAGDRYQVQVRSTDPSFTAADREAWLAKFKLTELK